MCCLGYLQFLHPEIGDMALSILIDVSDTLLVALGIESLGTSTTTQIKKLTKCKTEDKTCKNVQVC